MKTKALIPVIMVGIIIPTSCHFIAMAAIDAPHNESNDIYCGSCHGEGLLNSPFWGGTLSYDQLCLNCHTASSGPYTATNAPLVKTHSSENTSENHGIWSRECRNCHDPHYQKQKVYKDTDLYLATGTIFDCEYNGDGASTLSYSSISYKGGWDATKLTGKTNTYRRAIIFPNVGKLGYSYPVTGIDEVAQEILVLGDATPVYQYITSSTFAIMYGQYVKDILDNRQVKFFDQTGSNSYADGDTTYNGVCEVCHTLTDHFRNNGGAPDQDHANVGGAGGTNCISCHSHTDGFAHGGGVGTGCDSCHGYSGSHYRHCNVDPPATACSDCHNTSSFPEFADNESLDNTTVCDTCHSPGGAFNGVDDSVIGAKDNWEQGAYEGGAYPTALRSGKEKWCAGCHDNVPSVVHGITAPDIVGDNSAYGYYLDDHGNTGYGVSRLGVVYSKGECLHCHDVSKSGHGGRLFDVTDNFCFKCHDNTTAYAINAIKNRSYSYRAGGYTADSVDDILEAFSHHSHNLSDIKTFINGKWGYDADSNPCAACHNPHRVQGDPANEPDSTKSPDNRGFPVSRPSQHSTNYNNIWGDETGERMCDYTFYYQAPYRYGSTNAFEPDGSSTQNGSNLPDFNTFCTDCHNSTNTIYSSTLGRNLKTIDWNNEKHGRGDADGEITMNNPYGTVMGKVLSCTDCHEPHGSPNVFLLRNEVNGEELTNPVTAFNPDICTMGSTDGNKVLGWFCKRCHKDDYDLDKTFGVVNQWKYTHHFTGDEPYVRTQCYKCHWSGGGEPISCNCCHYHGSITADYGSDYPCVLDPPEDCGSPCYDPCDRRTF